MVAGLTVDEIVRALFSSEAAMARRITRAKTKIRDAHIPFVVPEPLTERLGDVLTVIYLIFNAGYLPGGDVELRVDLSDEVEFSRFGGQGSACEVGVVVGRS